MPRPKKKPAEPAPRAAVIHLKGSQEYVAWLEDVHKRTRLPKATIFRVAVEEWAARNNLPAPPEI